MVSLAQRIVSLSHSSSAGCRYDIFPLLHEIRLHSLFICSFAILNILYRNPGWGLLYWHLINPG